LGEKKCKEKVKLPKTLHVNAGGNVLRGSKNGWKRSISVKGRRMVRALSEKGKESSYETPEGGREVYTKEKRLPGVHGGKKKTLVATIQFSYLGREKKSVGAQNHITRGLAGENGEKGVRGGGGDRPVCAQFAPGTCRPSEKKKGEHNRLPELKKRGGTGRRRGIKVITPPQTARWGGKRQLQRLNHDHIEKKDWGTVIKTTETR